MKKIIFFFLFILSVAEVIAQCGTAPPIGNSLSPNLQMAYNSYMNNPIMGESTDTIPYKIHIVRTSSGTGGISVSILTNAFNNINNIFSNANLFFKQCGTINYIDNSNYYDFDKSDEIIITSANNTQNVINFYFFNSITSGTNSLCGYAKFPGGLDIVMMKNSCTSTGNTLAHEIGHYFNLYHTHETATGAELVNGTNCSTAGDQLCDTDADPTLGNSNVNSSCQYTGTATDINNQLYNPDPTNIMSYSRKSCRNFFSPLQYARISWTNTNLRNYLNCSSSTTSAPVNDNPNGATVIVSNGPCLTGTIANATSSYGANQCSGCSCTSPDDLDVYYKVTTSSTNLTVALANYSSNFDGVIELRSSPNFGSAISCYDPIGTPNSVTYTWTGLTPNTNYWIRVFEFNNTGTPPSSPLFDICATHTGGISSSHDFTIANLTTNQSNYNLGDPINIDCDQYTSTPNGSNVSPDLAYTLRDWSNNVLYTFGTDHSTLGGGDAYDGESISSSIPISGNYPMNCKICAEANHNNNVNENNTSNNLSCVNVSITTPCTPIAPPSIASIGQACTGLPITYNQTGVNVSNNYSWGVSSGGNILGSNTQSAVNISYNTSGNYNVYLYYHNGCQLDTVIYPVNVASVSADAGLDQTTNCTNTSVTIGAPSTSGISYAWSPSTGLSSVNVAQPTASPTSTTTYQLTTTGVTGCMAVDTVLVTVDNILPIVSAGPAQTIDCNTGSVILAGSSTNGLNHNWTPSTGLNSTSILQPTASPLNTTSYTLTTTGANGCVGFDSVLVTVNTASPMANAGADQTINCTNTIASLGVLPNANNMYNWSPCNGLSNCQISNPSALPLSTTDFILTVTGQNGCTNSDTVTVAIDNALPLADAGPNQYVSISNPNVTIGTTAVSGNSYLWSPNQNLSSYLSAQTLANPNVTTTYILQVTGANGCSAFDSVVVFYQFPTGVNVVGTNETITIYPNPVSSELSLRGKNLAGVSYNIMNKLGQRVSHAQLPSSYKIDVSHLPVGLYFLVLDNGAQFKFFKK